MDNEPTSAEPEYLPSKHNTKFIVIIIVLFILSISSAFTGGFYLNTLLKPQEINPGSIALPTPELPDDELINKTVIISGKGYYDDTVISITNNTPKKILVATATRQEAAEGVDQNTRVSYFDGSAWTRKILSKNYPTTGIYTNSIISDWEINIDPSRVLKQTVDGKITVDDTTITFNTGLISNNISIRSLPGYTKFISSSDGTLEINGSKLSAKILYTRIYSNNSREIQFYDVSLGVTTHWLAFWGAEGNVYHLDSTVIDNPTDIYQTHQIAVMVDNFGRVSKTFDVTINTDSGNPPGFYEIKLGSPIDRTITFNTDKSIEKAPSNTYSWFMSEGTGEVDGVKGFGVVEYIKSLK